MVDIEQKEKTEDNTKEEEFKLLTKKLESLADSISLVKNIVGIKDGNETYFYFIDDKDRCMCLPFSFIDEVVRRYNAKGKKDIMVI